MRPKGGPARPAEWADALQRAHADAVATGTGVPGLRTVVLSRLRTPERNR